MVTASIINHDSQSVITSITDEALLVHVKALEVRKLEKPKKLAAENSKYVTEIDSRQYQFNRGG